MLVHPLSRRQCAPYGFQGSKPRCVVDRPFLFSSGASAGSIFFSFRPARPFWRLASGFFFDLERAVFSGDGLSPSTGDASPLRLLSMFLPSAFSQAIPPPFSVCFWWARLFDRPAEYRGGRFSQTEKSLSGTCILFGSPGLHVAVFFWVRAFSVGFLAWVPLIRFFGKVRRLGHFSSFSLKRCRLRLSPPPVSPCIGHPPRGYVLAGAPLCWGRFISAVFLCAGDVPVSHSLFFLVFP